MYIYNTNNMSSPQLNFDTEQLSSMELYSLQLQKVVADFTDFDAITKQYVDQKVSQAKQELTDGASSALDTFKELEDYLTASGVAGGLVEQISALSASITAEASRAGTEEGKLDARVATLENSSVSANLQSELDATQQGAGLDLNGSYVADTARNYISSATSLKSADALLDSALKAEVDRAEGAESSLDSKINTETFQRQTLASNMVSNFSSVNTKIDDEKARAEGAEAGLSADIVAEATRAQGAETTLQSNIDAEILRATNKEGELQADIDNEKDRAEGAEAGLSSDIQAEATRAQGAEATLQSNIEANSALIVNKVGEVEAEVANEEHRARNAETALEAKIVAETARAVNAENALQANLDGVSSALSEDLNGINASLEGQIEAEQKRAEEAEQALGERPHDGANGGFGIQHEDGNPDNKYLYFSSSWRMFGSSSGDRLIFEYNKGTPEAPNFVTAVPFISHQ